MIYRLFFSTNLVTATTAQVKVSHPTTIWHSINTEYSFPNAIVVIYFQAIFFSLTDQQNWASPNNYLWVMLKCTGLCSADFHSGCLGMGYKGCSKLAPNVWCPGTMIHRLCSICGLRYCSTGCQNMISVVRSVTQWPLSCIAAWV